MLAASLVLGGLLPLDAQTLEQWPPSGAFRMPVGDPYAIAYERSLLPGTFFVMRSVEWDGARATHQGADLACGMAGLPVRAAAAGVVVRAADHGEFGGYGTHVVLAHRLAGGVLAYSVYAHMREASLRVHAGQRVQAGQQLGRVGMTGHATGPHLHFELRAADDPREPWEYARIEDPIAFVDERLPTHRAETTGTDALLEWGECAALLPPGANGGDGLTREAWWRMLAAAVRGPLFDPALEVHALRDALIAARILPLEARRGHAAVSASWHEVARDLARARRLGLRSGRGPMRLASYRELCESLVGLPAPGTHTAMLVGHAGEPTLAQAVALIADVAGPQPEPVRPAPPPVPLASLARPLHHRLAPGSTVAESLRVTGTRSDTSRASRAHAGAAHRDTLRTGGVRAGGVRTVAGRGDTTRMGTRPASGAGRDSVRTGTKLASGAGRDTASRTASVRVGGTHRDTTRAASVRRDSVTTGGVRSRSAHTDSARVRGTPPRADSLGPAKHPIHRRLAPPPDRPDSARPDSAHGGP